MSIKSDRWIRERSAGNAPMIEPFEPGQVRTGPDGGKIVSYGTSSYGYDVRCADEFKIFTNVHSTVVDPKAFETKASNVPHATLAAPGGPQSPKRSATADRKDNASATRRASAASRRPRGWSRTLIPEANAGAACRRRSVERTIRSRTHFPSPEPGSRRSRAEECRRVTRWNRDAPREARRLNRSAALKVHEPLPRNRLSKWIGVCTVRPIGP